MKMFFAPLVACILLASTAFAADSAVVANYRRSMPYPPFFQYNVAIHDDGSVTGTVSSPRGAHTTDLGQLSQERVAALRTAVDALQAGDLTDLDAGKEHLVGGPKCESTVVNGSGDTIAIAGLSGGHHLTLHGAEGLTAILEGFAALANL